jgi:(S)-mandelate dehydrogenase
VLCGINGRIPVWVDGGVRRGVDVVKALALGAQAVLIGRATLYGACAAGQPGAERALEILKIEFERAMKLCGARRLSQLDAGLICGAPTTWRHR